MHEYNIILSYKNYKVHLSDLQTLWTVKISRSQNRPITFMILLTLWTSYYGDRSEKVYESNGYT